MKDLAVREKAEFVSGFTILGKLTIDKEWLFISDFAFGAMTSLTNFDTLSVVSI